MGEKHADAKENKIKRKQEERESEKEEGEEKKQRLISSMDANIHS